MAMETILASVGVPVGLAVCGWVYKTVTDANETAKQAKSDIAVTHEALSGLKELITQRFDNLEEKQNERANAVEYRLQRVEKSMNGFLHRDDHSHVN